MTSLCSRTFAIWTRLYRTCEIPDSPLTRLNVLTPTYRFFFSCCLQQIYVAPWLLWAHNCCPAVFISNLLVAVPLFPTRWRRVFIKPPRLLCLRKLPVWAALTWNEAEHRTVLCTQGWHGWAVHDGTSVINCPGLIHAGTAGLCVFHWKSDI